MYMYIPPTATTITFNKMKESQQLFINMLVRLAGIIFIIHIEYCLYILLYYIYLYVHTVYNYHNIYIYIHIYVHISSYILYALCISYILYNY